MACVGKDDAVLDERAHLEVIGEAQTDVEAERYIAVDGVGECAAPVEREAEGTREAGAEPEAEAGG